MIVVTGGTGFVGSHLLLELLKENNPVRVIIREQSNPEKVLKVWKHYLQDPQTLLDRIDWYRCDITDKASLWEALQDAGQVYHCAAQVSLGGTKKKEMYETNLTGTQNIVNICIQQNIKKLLHVSSIVSIGKSLNGAPMSETNGWPVKSKSIYTQTKTLAELEVWRGITEGLNAVIVNPSVIIGAGDWQQNSSRFFDRVYNGLNFYTAGTTGFVDVHDVVNIMIRLMNSEIAGERFILNSENLSIRNLLTKIALALGTDVPSKYASPFITSLVWKAAYIKSVFNGKPPDFTRQSAQASHNIVYYSAEKIEKLLNFSFTPMDISISETAKHYLNGLKRSKI